MKRSSIQLALLATAALLASAWPARSQEAGLSTPVRLETGPVELHNPGRPIGGRACPRTVELDDRTLGTVFYDTDEKQPGGSGVFFRTMPAASLQPQASVPSK